MHSAQGVLLGTAMPGMQQEDFIAWEKLLEARKANTAMRQAARAEAQSEESALIAVARADADAKVKLAVADIQGAAEAASKALSVSAQALSSEIAGQVLGRQAQGEA